MKKKLIPIIFLFISSKALGMNFYGEETISNILGFKIGVSYLFSLNNSPKITQDTVPLSYLQGSFEIYPCFLNNLIKNTFLGIGIETYSNDIKEKKIDKTDINEPEKPTSLQFFNILITSIISLERPFKGFHIKIGFGSSTLSIDKEINNQINPKETHTETYKDIEGLVSSIGFFYAFKFFTGGYTEYDFTKLKNYNSLVIGIDIRYFTDYNKWEIITVMPYIGLYW